MLRCDPPILNFFKAYIMTICWTISEFCPAFMEIIMGYLSSILFMYNVTCWSILEHQNLIKLTMAYYFWYAVWVENNLLMIFVSVFIKAVVLYLVCFLFLLCVPIKFWCLDDTDLNLNKSFFGHNKRQRSWNRKMDFVLNCFESECSSSELRLPHGGTTLTCQLLLIWV